MIAALPAEGAVIVVATNAIGRWLLEGVQELRGPELAARCRTVTVRQASDCDKLAGIAGAVVLDWSFVALAKPHVRAAVEAATDAAAA